MSPWTRPVRYRAGRRLPDMTDDQDAVDAQRIELRKRYLAERARVAAVPADEWAAQRDAEVRTVRQAAAARRRSAA
jgi:hypothetical protein